jgi:ATP-dependent Clp protease ATP-binding subunit ClpC
MTSNIGARLITDKKSLGFANATSEDSQKEYENTKKDVMAELKRELRPEFINRIDEIMYFTRSRRQSFARL